LRKPRRVYIMAKIALTLDKRDQSRSVKFLRETFGMIMPRH